MVQAPQVGDQIGRYRLVEELGKGGMAVVFRAIDPSLEREVAIKVMHPHLWGNPEYAARFSREARAVAALRHPHIVEIYDFGGGEEHKGVPGYIISELLEGLTLRQFIDARGHPLPEVAAMVVLKLAQALQCAHRQGIIHRDLKPENVIITDKGRVVLTDFGIARIVEGESVTQTGALVGSPAYMSPEQARGLAIDARSDLFSLGVLLYLLCTGHLPFPGKDPISTVLRVLECAYEPPLKHNPSIGRQLARVITRLLQKEPADRMGSADAVIEALQQVLDEAGIEEIDIELERYFGDPGTYNRSLVNRVIQRSITSAQKARSQRDYPRALALCDRVLAFEPDHEQALELVTNITGRGRRNRVLLALGMTVLGATAVAAVLWYWGLPRSHPIVARAPAEPGPDLTASPDTAPMPDAGQPPDALQVSGLLPDGQRKAERIRPRSPRARRRRPDASVVGDAPVAVMPPDSGPLAPGPSHGRILVRIGPWCHVYLDGKRMGTSPMDHPIKVDPGRHELVCRQGQDGATLRRSITVSAGRLETLTGLVKPRIRVQMGLRRGDAVRIRGQRYSDDFWLPPLRYEVELLKGTVQIDRSWVTFPGRPCTLVDSPRLECR